MRGKYKTLSVRMVEIENAAGVDLSSDGRIDWDKYKAGQEALASANPEYKAVRDEVIALRNKKWQKKNAREDHTRELRSEFASLVHLPSLTDAQKRALRVARELLWQCKPATIERAEKTAKKEAANEIPPFTWPRQGIA